MTAAPLEYLTTRLHGRRTAMAEDERLLALSRLTRVSDLARAIGLPPEVAEPPPLERHWQAELIQELQELKRELSAPGDRLVAAMLARFQIENLKTVYRAWHSACPEESLSPHLFELAPEWQLDLRGLLGAGSFAHLVQHLPERWRQSAETCVPTAADHPDRPSPFLFEAALDRAGLDGLLAAGGALPPEEREVSDPVLHQEADLFHLQWVIRGRLLHRLSREQLLALHLPGTRLPHARFAAMLDATELSTVAALAQGRGIDHLPVWPSAQTDLGNPDLESLALQRLARLARRAFRRSHLGLGAVVGYVALRRVEIANLIRLAEGIQDGIARGELVEPWWVNTAKEVTHA